MPAAAEVNARATRRRGVLDVDGDRPSVAAVAALPESWTTSPQRLVLFALACDAFADVSRVPVGQLAEWVGLSRSRTFELLGDLTAPVGGVRPALLERVDRHGRRLPEGVRWGGVVGYRILPRSGEPSEPSDGTEPSGTSDGWPDVQPSGTSDGYAAEPSEEPSEQPSEQPSGASDTPFPPLPPNSSMHTTRASDVGGDIEGDADANENDNNNPDAAPADESDWDAYHRRCAEVGARPNRPGFQVWQREHTRNGDAA